MASIINGVKVSIKKGYSKQTRNGQEDPEGHFHNLHTLNITKQYPDRKDDVEVLEEVTSDVRQILESLEKELSRVKQTREWFKGTDLEF